MSAIVHNSGVNYTLYYNTINFFKTIMNNHPSIEVVTHGDVGDFDTREYPAYPIGNINILTADFGTNVTNYSIVLTIADKIKNKNDESDGRTNAQTIPFKGVDDTVDIHANTLAILNDITSYVQRGVDGFEINDSITCTKFEDQFNNGLAGWTAEFTLTTHNDRDRCLFFLITPEQVSEYRISACLSGMEYYATFNSEVVPGQVMSTVKTPGAPLTYPNLICYTIEQQVNVPETEIDFSNLPVLALPVANYGTCEECELWINPKVWGTTPATWGSAPYADFRTWATT
jgi:hypothetical protein